MVEFWIIMVDFVFYDEKNKAYPASERQFLNVFESIFRSTLFI